MLLVTKKLIFSFWGAINLVKKMFSKIKKRYCFVEIYRKGNVFDKVSSISEKLQQHLPEVVS